MLPGNTESSVAVSGVFLSPDDSSPGPIIDYEMGGIQIGDASKGLMFQNWTCTYDPANSAFMLQPSGGLPFQLFSYAGVSEIAFAFDQNMRPAVAFVVNGTMFLRWFDTVAVAFVVTSFGPGRNPRLALDDKRPEVINFQSDVIFAYLRDDGLYYRQQRDRFTVERQIRGGIDPTLKLAKVGMSNQLRLQFELA